MNKFLTSIFIITLLTSCLKTKIISEGTIKDYNLIYESLIIERKCNTTSKEKTLKFLKEALIVVPKLMREIGDAAKIRGMNKIAEAKLDTEYYNCNNSTNLNLKARIEEGIKRTSELYNSKL